MKASWGENELLVNSPSDLDIVVDSVRRSGQPTMVFLEEEDGTCLVFGVGRLESVLTFAEPDGTSFHSLGDRDRKGYLHFLCRDQIDEFMAEMAVSEHAALKAAEQFVETRKLPSAVVWEADW
jgi:hypothetical protein